MGNSLESINVDLSLELSGFDGQHDLGAGSWIVFDYLPSSVLCWVAFDNNSNARITVKQGMKIRAKHGSVFLWTSGTSSEKMRINHWAGDDLEIEYPPSSDFDSLQNLGAGALVSLDKIFNPHEKPTTSIGQSNTASLTTVLSKVLNCDKIGFILSPPHATNGEMNGFVEMYINGTRACLSSAYGGVSSSNPIKNYIFVSNGDLLEIKILVPTTAYYGSYLLEEYTLKA